MTGPGQDDEATVMRSECLAPEPALSLAALFDLDPVAVESGDALPPLWHWIYLLERPRQDELGPDGHALRGIPAPPGPGLLRMFGGGRVTTYALLRVGETASRLTTVAKSVEKEGKSGPFTVLTVRSEISQGEEVAVVDEQDIVYRGPESRLKSPVTPRPERTEPPAAPDRSDLSLDVDPVFLFRFSALTYNAHRIHYDRDYAVSEGYPDLVVHGPLQALLMGECMRRSGVSLLGKQFSYRLVAPTYGSQRLTATQSADDSAILAAHVRDGRGLLTATATLRDI